MPVKDGSKVKFGAEVTPDIRNVLGHCPTPDGIIANIDQFNGEILESHQGFVVSAKQEAERQAALTMEAAAAKLGFTRNKPEIKKMSDEKPIKRTLSSKNKKVAPAVNKSIINKPIISRPEAKIIKEAIKEEKIQTMSTRSFEEDIEELDKKVEDAAEEDGSIPRSKIMEALSKLSDSPSEAKIEHWKREFGSDSVHVTVFSEKEIYIYRHLTRSQWQKVQEMVAKIQSAKANVSEDELKEKVVSHCVLWPALSLEWKYQSRAGVLDALYQAIMLQSYFLSPQQVMQLTTEL